MYDTNKKGLLLVHCSSCGWIVCLTLSVIQLPQRLGQNRSQVCTVLTTQPSLVITEELTHIHRVTLKYTTLLFSYNQESNCLIYRLLTTARFVRFQLVTKCNSEQIYVSLLTIIKCCTYCWDCFRHTNRTV